MYFMTESDPHLVLVITTMVVIPTSALSPCHAALRQCIHCGARLNDWHIKVEFPGFGGQ